MKSECACDGVRTVRKYGVFQVLPAVFTNAWGNEEGVCPPYREIENMNAWREHAVRNVIVDTQLLTPKEAEW